jgi:DNA-binding NarL/FixJ family response regulator
VLLDRLGQSRVRVVLAEDHEVVRRGLVLLLNAEPDIRVVADVGDGLDAIEAARFHRPDVVIIDAALPGLDGIAAAAQIKAGRPETSVVVLTGSENAATFEAALAAGVDGYVPKAVPPAELVSAVRAVASGERFLHCPARRSRGRLSTESTMPLPRDFSLSPRELEVLRLMATSHTYREIASQLVVGEETVRSHVKSILHKLGQPDRTQAVVAAVKAGLLQLS